MAETFPNIPAHVESGGLKVEFKLLEATFGDGYEQVSREGLNHQRDSYDLTWANEDIDDATTIKNFLSARGGDQPFLWTPPNTVGAKLWRCTSYTAKPNGPLAETITANFKRWYGPG